MAIHQWILILEIGIIYRIFGTVIDHIVTSSFHLTVVSKERVFDSRKLLKEWCHLGMEYGIPNTLSMVGTHSIFNCNT